MQGPLLALVPTWPPVTGDTPPMVGTQPGTMEQHNLTQLGGGGTPFWNWTSISGAVEDGQDGLAPAGEAACWSWDLGLVLGITVAALTAVMLCALRR